MSLIRQVETVPADSPAQDAFGRSRVSNPVSLFNYQHQYDEGPIQWEYWDVGGGGYTHLPNESAVRLEVGTGATDASYKQSRQYYRYQPGKSQLILLTFVLGSSQANTTKQVGYFDDDNGLIFQQVGSALQFVRRSGTSGSPVDEVVNQASWNLDTFDGNGPSGITLDPTKSQILVIDLEWLGVGRVRMGFNVNGVTYYAHEFLNANNLATVYMTSANLPIRYAIFNTAGTAGAETMLAICSSISSEGGFEIETGNPFCVSNGVVTEAVAAATPEMILAIRPKATFNGQTNRGRILPTTFETYGQANSAHWVLRYDVTEVGAWTWNSVHPDSLVEYAINEGTAFSGGIPVECGYVPVSGSGNKARAGQRGGAEELFLYYPLSLDHLGANPIILAMTVEGISGTAEAAAAFSWLEFR